LVLAGYFVTVFTLGVTLAVVFQLAHAVGEARFSALADGDPRVHKDFAAHQVESTVDFARDSSFWTWFTGGLNFQVVHHLFPKICHVHYPALSRIVEATCREYGVLYSAYKSFRAGLAAHYRWLREMGRAPAAAA